MSYFIANGNRNRQESWDSETGNYEDDDAIDKFIRASVLAHLEWLGLKFTFEEPSDWDRLYEALISSYAHDDYYDHVRSEEQRY